MDLAAIAWPAILTGLGISLAVIAIISTGSAVARDFGLSSYPEAVQKQYGAGSERGRRVRPVVLVAMLVSFAVALTLLLLTLRTVIGPLDFVTAFVAAGIALLTFNLFDLIVLDLVLFVWWRPTFIVLPGTEGMSEYGDVGFHARGFLRGLIFVTVLALIAAGVTVALEWLL